MESKESIAHLENEVKILKNEVQAVLLDLRDKYLEADNPFNAPPPPASTEQTKTNQEPAVNVANPNTKLHGNSEKEEGNDKVKNSTEVPSKEKEIHPETAREEVIKAQVPEMATNNNRAQSNHTIGRNINLLTIGGLVNWADETVKKLGHQRTETILDVAEMMGLLSPELKRIMTKFINVDKDGDSEFHSARAFLDSLMKITTLLGKDNQTEAALFTILSGEDSHG